MDARTAQLEQRLEGVERTRAGEEVAVDGGGGAGGSEARERASIGALPAVGAHRQRTAGERHSKHDVREPSVSNGVSREREWD